MGHWTEGDLNTDVRHKQVNHFLATIKRAAREQRRWRERNLWRPWWSDETRIGSVGGGARVITSIGQRGGSETVDVKQTLAASKRSDQRWWRERNLRRSAISVSSEAGVRGG